MGLIEKLAKKIRTPRDVQIYLRALPYNRELGGETLRSAEQALRLGTAHCLEAAFVAAAVLEVNGYPPLVMSLESQDQLDHVIFVFQKNGRWGSVGRSRDEGLHGRPPSYRSLRDLAWSYFDPYIDKTGRITGYQMAHLDDSLADWRRSPRNVWKTEQYLIDLRHKPLPSSDLRYRRLFARYQAAGPLPLRRGWW